jgi:hypothetical protein
MRNWTSAPPWNKPTKPAATDERIRYDAPCQPPLAPEDQAWANELIRAG